MAMMQILKEKYKLMDAFKILKSFMFGEKGDRLDSYTELLFKETSTVNWSAVFNANSYFEDRAIYVNTVILTNNFIIITFALESS